MTAAPAFTFLLTGPEINHVRSESLCYRLPSFPPPEDFVVMVNTAGQPLSRYGDYKWRIGSMPFNFGTNPADLGPKGLAVNDVNGELLKRCLCWFIYGDRRGVSIQTLAVYHTALKPIFAFCSNLPRPIAASDLSRFSENLLDALAQTIRPSAGKTLANLLHELWLAREQLGFYLLDPKQIARLRQLVPAHEIRQTNCIPPRIWAYQAGRLQAFLEDFIDHESQFEAVFMDLVSAYRENYGTLKASIKGRHNRNPCYSATKFHIRGCTYLGSFSALAERHGISHIITRWLFQSGRSWGQSYRQSETISLLTKYFNAVGRVGAAYIQCFSGMRISEVMSLRCDCLSVEHDDLLGDINILRGETTKTTQDDDARWLTAPTVSLAVKAMSAVARWRTEVAAELGFVPLTPEDLRNPYLIQRAYEPWASGNSARSKSRPLNVRPGNFEIGRWKLSLPWLFEEEPLRITAEDEAFVRRFSTNQDISKYSSGCIWPLASHQYRRSAAVMMGSSQVSLESQQYQFKHLTLNQSAYYRRGSQGLRLNRTFSHELAEARYELVAVDLALLNGPEYISPISPRRKDEILSFHELGSGDALQRAIKKGELSVKQTLFGVCTRRDRCPYGGHDNYAHCSDCNDALLSKRKRPGVERLGKTIAVRLIDAPPGSPLRTQLERSAKAIERFLDATA